MICSGGATPTSPPARWSWTYRQHLFSPSSATQGHQPFTVFCSKRDTNRSGWKVASSWSTEHFGCLGGLLGMVKVQLQRACGKEGCFSQAFSVTASLGLSCGSNSTLHPSPLIPSVQLPIHLFTHPYAH